jgi:hypothetical protein
MTESYTRCASRGHCRHRAYWLWWGRVGHGQLRTEECHVPHTIEAADDLWECIDYLANSILFLLLGFELALTNQVQSLPGIFFGLLGAVIGRVLMI